MSGANRFYNKWGQLYKDTVPYPSKVGENSFAFNSPRQGGGINQFVMPRSEAMGWLRMAEGMKEADAQEGIKPKITLPPDEFTNEQMQKWQWLDKIMKSGLMPT